MRISATDIDDGNNSIVLYELEPKLEVDEGYLRIDANTGVIFLNRTINVSHKISYSLGLCEINLKNYSDYIANPAPWFCYIGATTFRSLIGTHITGNNRSYKTTC
jgi:hypothetical protein